jgi:deoxycytidylate deaminase
MIKKLLNVNRSRNRVKGAQVVHNPELVFGIVGPIGVDIDAVMEGLSNALKDVEYRPISIHLTELIEDRGIKVKRDFSTYYDRYHSLIEYANAYRTLAKSAAAMAGVAIVKIRELRAKASGSETTPARGTAYIVRQFKRPEEIELMRQVYGRKFIQVSVFGSATDRRRVMMEKIRRFEASPKTDAECEAQAIKLIDIDHNQKDDINGQRIADVFHLGDVFVDGIDPSKANETIQRFIHAFFGDTRASPNKDEYGLYISAAAALRSADLSRQVGAAIFTKKGEIISIGCNEVPKAGGGTYWIDDEPPIFRDIEAGVDANQDRKTEIMYDLAIRMGQEGFLFNAIVRLKSPQKQVEVLLANPTLKDSQIMDIIEFGRMIHAEMLAISDAARLGRATKGATLYCTTFPCHLCAKHIVAAGIDRVVFLEPYPKSYAQKLHGDSITFEKDVPEKVLFQPFMGISPRRYRDIFEKRTARKDKNGMAKEWYEGRPIPLVEDRSPAYIANEEPSIYVALKGLRKARNARGAAEASAA